MLWSMVSLFPRSMVKNERGRNTFGIAFRFSQTVPFLFNVCETSLGLILWENITVSGAAACDDGAVQPTVEWAVRIVYHQCLTVFYILLFFVSLLLITAFSCLLPLPNFSCLPFVPFIILLLPLPFSSLACHFHF